MLRGRHRFRYDSWNEFDAAPLARLRAARGSRLLGDAGYGGSTEAGASDFEVALRGAPRHLRRRRLGCASRRGRSERCSGQLSVPSRDQPRSLTRTCSRRVATSSVVGGRPASARRASRVRIRCWLRSAAASARARTRRSAASTLLPAGRRDMPRCRRRDARRSRQLRLRRRPLPAGAGRPRPARDRDLWRRRPLHPGEPTGRITVERRGPILESMRPRVGDAVADLRPRSLAGTFVP
jgi:hypothetical protein